jgi:rSAM/selenodomain-associated transferase 1
MDGNRCIIMLVKYPENGRVKSRLAAALDEKTAADLYRCFVGDLLHTLRQSSYPFKISYFPPDLEDKVGQWLGKELAYQPQAGANLGERMKNAFAQIFREGFRQVLLIGSDSPDLPGTIFDEAFHALVHNDAVLGPSPDGGYYLIGFKTQTFLPHVFTGVEWGTEKVFAQTMSVFESHQYRVHILPPWRDVDRIEDLATLYQENRGKAFASSKTMAYILNNRERIL